jgi:hypothetical protein
LGINGCGQAPLAYPYDAAPTAAAGASIRGAKRIFVSVFATATRNASDYGIGGSRVVLDIQHNGAASAAATCSYRGGIITTHRAIFTIRYKCATINGNRIRLNQDQAPASMACSFIIVKAFARIAIVTGAAAAAHKEPIIRRTKSNTAQTLPTAACNTGSVTTKATERTSTTL